MCDADFLFGGGGPAVCPVASTGDAGAQAVAAAVIALTSTAPIRGNELRAAVGASTTTLTRLPTSRKANLTAQERAAMAVAAARDEISVPDVDDAAAADTPVCSRQLDAATWPAYQRLARDRCTLSGAAAASLVDAEYAAAALKRGAAAPSRHPVLSAIVAAVKPDAAAGALSSYVEVCSSLSLWTVLLAARAAAASGADELGRARAVAQVVAAAARHDATALRGRPTESASAALKGAAAAEIRPLFAAVYHVALSAADTGRWAELGVCAVLMDAIGCAHTAVVGSALLLRAAELLTAAGAMSARAVPWLRGLLSAWNGAESPAMKEAMVLPRGPYRIPCNVHAAVQREVIRVPTATELRVADQKFYENRKH